MESLPLRGVGIDMVDIVRFAPYKEDSEHDFLKKVFSEQELAYCFAFADPTSHLAGMFAAKEAASKALGTALFPFAELEIRHDSYGAPSVWHKGSKLPVSVSITHTDTLASAIAVT